MVEDEKIREMLDAYPEDGRIPCAVAHYIAALLSVAPIRVAKVINQMGLKIYQCQLGLFGYGRKGVSSYKVIGREVDVPQRFKELLEEETGGEMVVSCEMLWDIAEEVGVTRFEAGNAADAYGYKITPCQLGCF